MSLSPEAVDRLIARMQVTYGRDFMDLYLGLDPAAVRESWAYELGCFAQCLHVIAWGLENLPPKACNAVAFRQLCRGAPAREVPQLPAPKPDPARLAAQLQKMADLSMRTRQPRSDAREWAQRVLDRHAAGERFGRFALEAARAVFAKAGGGVSA